MSLQKAATILNVLNQHIPVIATAIDINTDPVLFMESVLLKQGWPISDVNALNPLLQAVAAVVKAP